MPAHSGLELLCVARPELEYRLRAQLTTLPNVMIMSGTVVTGLAASAERDTVTGVQIRDGDSLTTINADLVVDASGRGSDASDWLADVGYGKPPEQRIPIDIAYSSCAFSMPADTLAEDLGILVAPTPSNPRGGSVVHMGNGKWLVSLWGFRDHHPPVTLDGFLGFARELAVSDVYEAVSRGAPIGRPVRYRTPETVRRSFERMTRFPDRFVIVGDAVSTLNPVYGQGMSVAADQALVLRRHLLTHGAQNLPLLRRSIAKSSRGAWLRSINMDLRMPWIPGPRSPVMRLNNAYVTLLYQAARKDPKVARAFIRVVNLMASPAGLVRPSIIGRVMLSNLLRLGGSRQKQEPGPLTHETAQNPAPRRTRRRSTDD